MQRPSNSCGTLAGALQSSVLNAGATSAVFVLCLLLPNRGSCSMCVYVEYCSKKRNNYIYDSTGSVEGFDQKMLALQAEIDAVRVRTDLLSQVTEPLSQHLRRVDSHHTLNALPTYPLLTCTPVRSGAYHV